MGKAIFDTSMSLDGFMAAPNVRAEEPMGDAGSASTRGRSVRTSATRRSSRTEWPATAR
jgi:hypothetical protein